MVVPGLVRGFLLGVGLVLLLRRFELFLVELLHQLDELFRLSIV